MKFRDTEIFQSSSLISILIVITSCTEPISGPEETVDLPRIRIENNEAHLAGRITYRDDDVALRKIDSEGADDTVRVEGLQLKLRAEIEPPIFDEFNLHASHVTVDDEFAYVSYSTPNETFRGGVEIYDIRSSDRPKLVSQALLNETDVRIALRHGDQLLLGEAIGNHDAVVASTPACLEVMQLRDDKLTSDSKLIDLPSFNANDIAIMNDLILVTSGSTGGALSILDASGLTVIDQVAVERAKAVAFLDNEIVVMEGTGTNLHLFDQISRSLLRTIPVGAPNFLQAKAEIDIVGDRVYLSAWESGMFVVDLGTESVVGSIPVKSGGVCNAVSVSGEFAFLANGKRGLLVAQITDTGFVPLGRAVFTGSTNFVTARGNKIFVANGRGGFIYIELILGGIEIFP